MLKVNSYKFYEFILFGLFILLYYFTFEHKDSIIVTLTLLVLVFFLCYFEYVRLKRFNSPILFWYVFWLSIISIGRMDLNIYFFNSQWDNTLLLYVIISTITFFISYWIGEIGSITSIVIKDDELTDWDKLLRALCWLLSIGIIAYLLNVIVCGSIPQLSGNVNVARAGFVTTVFYKIVNALRCVFMFLPLGLKFGKSYILKRRVTVLAVIFFVLEMLSGWRGYTFQAIFMIITSWFLTTDIHNSAEKNKNKRKMIIIGAFSFAFIAFIFITRANLSGSFKVLFKYVVNSIYLYFAPNFLNFLNAIRTVTPKGYPLYSTEAIWSIFISPDSISAYENINQNIGAYNVSTYMLQPYADNGLLGVVICTFFIAFISGISYKKCYVKPSMVWITILCIMNVTIFTMHNGFFLRASSAIFWLIIGCFLQWYIHPQFYLTETVEE